MQVKVEEIQDKGLELNEPIPAAVLDEALAASNGFVRKGDSKLKARFTKLAGRVLLTGSFDAAVACPCKRCLKEVAQQVAVKFELNLIAAPKDDRDDDDGEGEDDGRSVRAGSFRIDEADSEPFDGKKIELDPIIREQLVLALPVSVLCKDDCKGLCTVCGQDLNERDCGHVQKVGHLGLAKLKDIKLN
ncbi:MAG: DUF177 domain-containing protein [Myxococcaceae bacterium]|nr:DUF177 domain-containing protein [Myxococcaceae bacterium]